MLCSLSLGLDASIEDLEHNDDFGNYLLGGFHKLKGDEKRCLAIVSFSCQPVEVVLLRQLKDDRFLLFAQELKQAMNDEWLRVARTKDFVWTRIAEFVGMSPFGLRHEALYATAISCSYAVRDNWSELEKEPLKYTQGDIHRNVEELKAREDRSADPFTEQMQDLLEHGAFPRRGHANGVEAWARLYSVGGGGPRLFGGFDARASRLV